MKRNSPVKGLILYELYSSKGNLLLMLMIVLLIGLGSLITGYKYSFFLFVAACITLFSHILIASSSVKSSISRWDRFQLAMPVKRNHVIASKYITHLLILAVSVIFAVAFTGLNLMLNESLIAFTNLIRLTFYFSICISLVGCSLFYPFACIMRKKNEEALATISLLVAVTLSVFAMLRGLKENLSINTIGFICIAVSAVIFVVSYTITLKIYSKKDF